MSLYELIIAEYPELADKPNEFNGQGSIILQDDSDGHGAYIAKWEYTKPLPDGLKLGK